MPFLTIPIGAEGASIDLHVALEYATDRCPQGGREGLPAARAGPRLIDTGASISAISPRIANTLGLVPTGKATIKSATTGPASHTCNLYDVALAFLQPGLQTHIFGVTIPVIELDLGSPGIDAILGRDLLRQCLCVYDGKRGEPTLAF